MIVSILELAVGNIVKRVLKVIREVSRGELETEGKRGRETTEHDYSSFEDDEEEDEEEDEDEEEEDEGDVLKSSKNSSVAGNRPQLPTQTSMFGLLADVSMMSVKEQKREENEKKIKDTFNLKPLIIQEITEEIIADLDTIYKGIADQALDFIHAK
jgi:translation initiation factor eIF-2B subunit beta